MASDEAATALADLDDAVASGDWTDVGALAATLASLGHGGHTRASRDRDSPEAEGGPSSPLVSGVAANTRRVAEIDALIGKGDWEGVIYAAARYEAGSSVSGTSRASGSLSGTITSVTSAARSADDEAEAAVAAKA